MQNKASFLTITQAAEFLKVSPDTLRRWEDKGIITPQRTKGGSRRYTLLDLKIAKLNKRKGWKNYINSRRDLKIALLTSFLWIFGLLIYQFLPPIFLRPTNPEQQISLDQLKKPGNLKTALGKVFILPDSIDKITPKVTTLGADLLIQQSGSLPALKYTDTPDQYYSLSYSNKKNLTP